MVLNLDGNRIPSPGEVGRLQELVYSLTEAYSEASKTNQIVNTFGLQSPLKNLEICVKGQCVREKGFPVKTLGYLVSDLTDAIAGLNVHEAYRARDDINELLAPWLCKAKNKQSLPNV